MLTTIRISISGIFFICNLFDLKRKTDDALRLFSGGGDISEILLKDYDYYLDKSKQLISELYKVVSCPEDIDNIQSEEEQAKFVIAFSLSSKST